MRRAFNAFGENRLERQCGAISFNAQIKKRSTRRKLVKHEKAGKKIYVVCFAKGPTKVCVVAQSTVGGGI